MDIKCPNCNAFWMEIKEATGIFDTRGHCRCNHDMRLRIRPGYPVQVTSVLTPRHRKTVRILQTDPDKVKSHPAGKR